MTNDSDQFLEVLRNTNSTAAFNMWLGLRVEEAQPGHVVLTMPWRVEAGQYAGFLHAGIIGGLLDTACGFAAVTMVGTGVLAAHFSVSCLRPAAGESFIVRARVIKPGKTTVFTAAELYAVVDGQEKLVATGDAILNVVSAVSA